MAGSASSGLSSAPTASIRATAESRGRQARLQSIGPREIVIVLIVLGAALRFATLNVQSIFADEADTLILIHRGFSGMFNHITETESSPPLYYILAFAWTKVFGTSIAGYRSLSALIGTLTIPVMYLAGREVSPRVGVWAAALTAISPSMYFFSQETRCYPLLVLFSAAAYICWQRALREPTPRRLWLWAAMSSLAVLTHYFAAFLFIPETIILARRLDLRRVWAPAAAVAVVGLALVPLAISQRADGKTNWIEELTLPRRVIESLKWFTVGEYALLVLPALALALLLSAGAVALVRRRGSEREQAGAWDAGVVALAALALPLALAVTHIIDVYDGANVIATWVPLTMLVACGLGSDRARRNGALIGVGLCAISVAMIVSTDVIPAYGRDDWRGVSRALGRPATTRIIVTEAHASGPLTIYLGKVDPVTSATISTSEVDFVGLRNRRTVGPPSAPVVPSTAPEGFRLVGVTRTETYAISHFIAAGPTTVTASSLRRVDGDSSAEIIRQP
jgi:hypothetical protein